MTPSPVGIEDGSLHFTRGAALVRGVRASVSWDDTDGRSVRWTPSLMAVGENRWASTPGESAAHGMALEVRAACLGEEALVLTATVENRGRAARHLRELALLRAMDGHPIHLGGEADTRRWQRFQQGWQSWSNARVYGPSDRQVVSPVPFWRRQVSNGFHRPSGRRGALRSEVVSVIWAGEAALLVGFVRGDRQFGGIDLDLAGGRVARFVVGCDLDGTALAPGRSVESEPLLVLTGSDPVALLERWADELGARQGARVPGRSPSGWCSWYHYYAKVTESDVRENLVAADELGVRLPLDYLMVDDGHQRRIGDWLDTADAFPAGMGDLAARIVASGRDAGIWLAPFLVDPDSDLARQHPDWVVRHRGGRPIAPLWSPLWNRRKAMRVLDTTHPEVLRWLEALAHHVRYRWGFRILKLDFLYAAGLPGLRHDPDRTRAEAVRAGLEAIRAGAGDDAFLLGCGCPLGPAVGIVDGMRIGADVAPVWDFAPLRWLTRDEAGASSRVAVRNVLTRAVLHRRLWVNDPDCLLVRTERSRLRLGEIRVMLAASALTDGMLVVSDRLGGLPADRVDLLATALDLAGGRPRVPDLFERPMPEVVIAARAHDTLVGLLNLDGGTGRRSVDVGRYGIADGTYPELLTGGIVAVRGGVAELSGLEGRDARVLQCPPDDRYPPWDSNPEPAD